MSNIILALIVAAQIIAGLFHAPMWVSLALILISALDFGFCVGRATRREIIYLHHDAGYDRKDVEKSGDNIRSSYREAKLPIPIILVVPHGMRVDRRPKI